MSRGIVKRRRSTRIPEMEQKRKQWESFMMDLVESAKSFYPKRYPDANPYVKPSNTTNTTRSVTAVHKSYHQQHQEITTSHCESSSTPYVIQKISQTSQSHYQVTFFEYSQSNNISNRLHLMEDAIKQISLAY